MTRGAAIAVALGAPDAPTQIKDIHAVLSAMDPTKAAGEAAAALARTRDGSPAARAYLTTVATSFTTGPSPSADAVVAYCASMERGRKPVRGAFLAVWKRATDLRAVDAACKNLARVMIDDPDLLDVAIEVAGRLGDRQALADYGARLDRATRLGPFVAELANPATRANASRKLARLTAEDRRHVHGRVVDSPTSFAPSLAATAVLALADDPAVADVCLANAIAVMQPAPLVKSWDRRVAHDDALVARLLGLFEWTALWATDPKELELYAKSLARVASRRDVFSQIENALSSDREVVRESICLHWLGNYSYSDPQRDTLMRMTVALADSRDDTRDRRAATAALAGTRFDASFPALADGARNTRSKALRAIVYGSIAHNRHAGVGPFLIDRLFVEKDCLGPLVDAFVMRRDPAFHQRVVATLVERAAEPTAIRAATLYADVLLVRKARGFIVELAQAIRSWQATSTDDQRRLRYLFEHAAVAVPATNRPLARELHARANELPPSGYSDYHVVAHDRVTPMPAAARLALLDRPSRAPR